MKMKSSKVLKSLIAVILAVLMIVGTTATGFAAIINVSNTGWNVAYLVGAIGSGSWTHYASENIMNNLEGKSLYGIVKNFDANQQFRFRIDVNDNKQIGPYANYVVSGTMKDYGGKEEYNNYFGINTTVSGEYAFTFDGNDGNKVSVYYPSTRRVWLYNSSSWTKPTIYLFSSKTGISYGWPGAEMNRYGNSNYYYWDVGNEIYDKCIFSNDGETQSADLDVTENEVYDNSSKLWKGVPYEVTINPSSDGSASISPSDNDGNKYLLTSSLKSYTITATPNEGYKFTRWTCTGGAHVNSDTSTSTTITASSNGTVTPAFEQAEALYTISSSVSPSGGGSVSVSGKAGATTQATLTATASSKYTFDKWTLPETVSLVSGYNLTNKTIKVNASEDSTVTASFIEDDYVTKGDILWMRKPHSYNWGSDVYASFGNASDTAQFPGVKMTLFNTINNYDYYYVILPSTYTSHYYKVEFNHNNSTVDRTGLLKISGFNGSGNGYGCNIVYESGWKGTWNKVTKEIPAKISVNTTGSSSVTPSSATYAVNSVDGSFTGFTAGIDIATVTKTGYTFKNSWSSNVSGGTFGDSTKMSTTYTPPSNPATSGSVKSGQVIQLTPGNEANQYDVTFQGNGSDATYTETIEETFESNYILPETNPTKTGYGFVGWYDTSASSGGSKITTSIKVTTASDHDLYARWNPNSYTVTFDANEPNDRTGQATGYDNTKSVKYDGMYGELKAASLPGYTFTGWYTEAGDSGHEVTALDTYRIAGNQTLYAHWTANTYTITFNGNAPSGSTATVTPSSAIVTYDQTYEGHLATASIPGYTFDGWFTASSGGKQIKETDTVLITEDTTLYAHWHESKANITVKTDGTQDVNSGVTSKATISLNSVTAKTEITGNIGSVTASTITATSIKGYHFVNWTVSDENIVDIANFSSASTTVIFHNKLDADDPSGSSRVTIIANFAKNQRNATAHGRFTDNGTTYEQTNTDGIDFDNYVSTNGPVAYKETAKYTARDCEGYEFVGWYSNITGSSLGTLKSTNKEYTFEQGDSDTTYYALYKKVYKVTIESIPAGISNVTIAVGSSVDTVTSKSELSYLAGDKLTIQANVSSGKVFAFWESDNKAFDGANNVEAKFDYTVNTDHGDIKLTPNAIDDPGAGMKIVWMDNINHSTDADSQKWETPHIYVATNSTPEESYKGMSWPGVSMYRLCKLEKGEFIQDNIWFYVFPEKYNKIAFTNGYATYNHDSTSDIINPKSGNIYKPERTNDDRKLNYDTYQGTTAIPIKVTVETGSNANKVNPELARSGAYVMSKESNMYYGTGATEYITYGAGLEISAEPTSRDTYHFRNSGWAITGGTGVFADQLTDQPSKFVPITAGSLDTGVTLTANYDINEEKKIGFVNDQLPEHITGIGKASNVFSNYVMVTSGTQNQNIYFKLDSGFYVTGINLYKDGDKGTSPKFTPHFTANNNYFTISQMPDYNLIVEPVVKEMHVASSVVYLNGANDNTTKTGGTVTISGADRTTNKFIVDNLVTYTATPKSGYAFYGWFKSTDFTKPAVSTDAKYQVKMGHEDITLYAMFYKKVYVAGPAAYPDGDATSPWYTDRFFDVSYEPSNNSYYYYFQNIAAGDGGIHSEFSFYKNNSNTGTNADKIPIVNISQTAGYQGTGIKLWVPENHETSNPNIYNIQSSYEAPTRIQLKAAQKVNNNWTIVATGQPDGLMLYQENNVYSISATANNSGKIVLSDGRNLNNSNYISTTSFTDKTIPSGKQYKIKSGDNVVETYWKAPIIAGKTNYEIVTALSGTDAENLYVEAFVVYNNNNKKATKLDAVGIGNNKYKTTLTNVEPGNSYYVCPVILHTDNYLKGTGGKRNKVFVDTSNLPAAWGGLISIYSWEANSKEAHGKFPGQLMIPTEDGRWYSYIESQNSSDKFNGCLFTNYYQDSVISNENSIFTQYGSSTGGEIYQTYDYREAYSLTEAGYSNLTFNFTDSDVKYHGDSTHWDKDGNNETVTAADVADIESKYNFQYLTTRDQSTLLDLNYEKIYDENNNRYKTPEDNLPADYYVVCKGDVYYKTEVTYGYYEDYTGQWSVDWYVYERDNTTGKYIGKTLSAAYFDGIVLGEDTKTPSYLVNEILKNKTIDGKVVKISYEKANKDKGSSVKRFSGQWYGTNANEKVNANIVVGTLGLTDLTTFDTIPQNKVTINAPGQSGYTALNINTNYGSAFVGPADGSDTTHQSYDVLLSSGDISLGSKINNTEKMFVGYYIASKDSSGNVVYSLVRSNESDTYNITNKTTVYAFFRDIPTGSIVISNGIYSNSNGNLGDLSNNGKIITHVAIYNGDTTEGTPIAESNYVSDGTATITAQVNKNSRYTVEISSETYQDSTFNAWYEKDSVTEKYSKSELTPSETPQPNSKAVATISFTYTDSSPKTYNYYSDAFKRSSEVRYIYKYVDRFNNPKTYVVKGELSDEEMDGFYNGSTTYPGNNGNKYVPTYLWTQKWVKGAEVKYTSAENVGDISQPSGYTKAPAPFNNPYNKVLQNAPKSNQATIYGQDVSWKITDTTFSKGSSQITLTAVQTKQTYTVTYKYLDSTGQERMGVYAHNESTKIPENTLVTIDENITLEYTSSPFKYWKNAKTGEYITRNPKYQLVVAEDVQIEAVYGSDPSFEGWKVSVSNLTKTRQITTDTDNCFVDCLVSFNDSKGTLLKGKDKSLIKYGIAYVININADDKHDFEFYKQHKNDMSTETWKFPDDVASKTKVENMISNMDHNQGLVTDKDTTSNRYILCYNCKALGYDVSNLNRAQIQSPALKTSSYASRSYTAYAFIEIDGKVYLSEGQNFYLADQLDSTN